MVWILSPVLVFKFLVNFVSHVSVMMKGHINSWIPSLILNLFCTLYHLSRFLPTDADGLGRGGDIEEKEAFLFLTSLLECSAHHRRFIWKQKQTERYLRRSMLNIIKRVGDWFVAFFTSFFSFSCPCLNCIVRDLLWFKVNLKTLWIVQF